MYTISAGGAMEKGLVSSQARASTTMHVAIPAVEVVQGLLVVPVFVYRYSMQISLKKARSPGKTEGGRSD